MRILFLCTGNACRSQMAEGWARALLASEVDVHSAGLKPGGVDARAAAVMAECAVDISAQRSKHLDELSAFEFDWIFTLCGDADERCPRVPGNVRRRHVGFDDPPRLAAECVDEEQALKPYRRVRDEIRRFVESLPVLLQSAAD
jgi:arsenate reductase